MTAVLADDVEAVLDLATGTPDPLLREMETYARERSFPLIGPASGRLLRLLAGFVEARRIFEFGSGFGYSAVWFAPALPDDGEIVLTDYDPVNLDRARDFLERAGHAAKARFEAGDALEAWNRHDGPFDVVLVDLDKWLYPDALDAASGGLAPGGVLVADNVLSGPFDPATIRGVLEGTETSNESARGVVTYLERVRDDPAFETTVLPLGSGLAVSRFVGKSGFGR